MIKETIGLLGLRAKDKVTGFAGVITSACFDLYGCVQVALTPSAEGKEETKFGNWFDVNRIELNEQDRVMPVPKFDSYGTNPQDYRQGASPKMAPRA